MKSINNNESGAIMVFVAVTVGAIILLLMFAIDYGWMSYSRNRAQAAVDAAALAGAAGLPDYNVDGSEAVVDSLVQQFNGFDPSLGSNTVVKGDPMLSIDQVQFMNYSDGVLNPAVTYTDANGVRVTQQYRVPLFFANYLKIPDWEFSVKATAVLGGPGCIEVTLPMALINSELPTPIDMCDLPCGTDEVRAVLSDSTQDTAGWFSPPGSRNTNANHCRPPYDTILLCAGDIIPMMNGVVSSCVNALETQCDNWVNPDTGVRGCSSTNPWPVFVPVVLDQDLTGPNHNPNNATPNPVVGFTKVGITDVFRANTGNPGFTFIHMCGDTVPSAGGGRSCGLNATSPVLVE